SYRPSVEDCQMSTSAPTTGRSFTSRNQARTNSASPGVGERTIEAPLGVGGDCWRQNGPSRLASVSPPLPLFKRQTRADRPSEPAIRTASLWESVEALPMALT